MHQTLCSTRVSNEFGEVNPQAAKMTVKAIMVLVVSEVVMIANMGPLIGLLIFIDGLSSSFNFK